ncbi:MAG: fructose-bisphosphate aldolase [Fimbriimonas sp.]|nr:fructose-bisphosphate aldolase [Fimbriimonas sp.]
MSAPKLGERAKALFANYKGLLAMDESNPTCNKRFAATGIPQTVEARQLGERLSLIEFSRIYSSPQQRAKRTCELTLPETAFDTEPDLAEWNYGDYEGKLTQDIWKVRSNWDFFRDGCPGGESPRQVAARADRLIGRLRVLGGNVALVTHGQFGSVVAMRWIGLPVADAEHFPLGTGSISILAFAAHHPEVAVVTRWNTPGGPSFDLGNYPRIDPLTEAKPVGIARWENEGGEISAQPQIPLEDTVRVGAVL